jgi:hypothetical protein
MLFTSGYYLLPERIFPALEEGFLLVGLVLEFAEEIALAPTKMGGSLHFHVNIHVAGLLAPQVFDATAP